MQMRTDFNNGIYRVFVDDKLVAETADKNVADTVRTHFLAQAASELMSNMSSSINPPQFKEVLQQVESALGGNLVFISDLADLRVRQKDEETLRRLEQLNSAWERLIKLMSVMAIPTESQVVAQEERERLKNV